LLFQTCPTVGHSAFDIVNLDLVGDEVFILEITVN
jgi:hypothetical protein